MYQTNRRLYQGAGAGDQAAVIVRPGQLPVLPEGVLGEYLQAPLQKAEVGGSSRHKKVPSGPDQGAFRCSLRLHRQIPPIIQSSQASNQSRQQRVKVEAQAIEPSSNEIQIVNDIKLKTNSNNYQTGCGLLPIAAISFLFYRL